MLPNKIFITYKLNQIIELIYLIRSEEFGVTFFNNARPGFSSILAVIVDEFIFSSVVLVDRNPVIHAHLDPGSKAPDFASEDSTILCIIKRLTRRDDNLRINK